MSPFKEFPKSATNNNIYFPHSSISKESACGQETWVLFLGWEDPLEKEMATHFSRILEYAWRIPQTEDPGWLQSMGLQESDMT